MLRPLVEHAETVGEVARQWENRAPATSPKRVSLDVWLRPPGALREREFLDTCSRCVTCVEVCPADAIKLDANGRLGEGAPFIDANSMACVVCDSLACMNECPSGALLPTIVDEIDMGTAVWHGDTCLRGPSGDDEDCRLCIEQCPLGQRAIRLSNEGRVEVNPNGCIGCGVCQFTCPTSPRSIIVIPKAKREA